jgi:hypothetical protein
MIESNNQLPGVYLKEIDGVCNSVVAVATAVPAFIGYTPQAKYEGKSYANIAQKITSFADFKAFYCYGDPAAPADPVKQYNPQYYLVQEKSKPFDKDYLIINNSYYSVLPDPNTIYYLYNSVKLFYQNGGGDAYIVSVGTYGAPSGNPINPGEQIVNPNVKLADLQAGLALLVNEGEPTMYICPEATLLSVAENSMLMEEMLLQCTNTQTSISVFDIIGGRNPDPFSYTQDIETFREGTGVIGLKYGTAYYPFIGTTIMDDSEIDFSNIFGGDVKQLAPLINPPATANQAITTILENIENPQCAKLSVSEYSNALTNASEVYKNILKHILADANILPPSGAMAGIMATIDSQCGVWKAPANVTPVGASVLPISLSQKQQENLNMDAVSGKSINVIRFFDGIGIVVWGARTLDGNSLDWKYLSVRRTVTMIEQSCKLAAHQYVFQPNDKNTWEAVKSMISAFLTTIWNQGGLMGASVSDAFSVVCGFGTTMTAEDILQGFMNVTVKLALVRPAEFIVLTFQQQMAASS